MPKRSLVVKKLTFWKKNSRIRNRETFSPRDLSGISLLDLISEWLDAPSSLPTMSEDSEDCIKLKGYRRDDDSGMILIDSFSGKAGERGEVYSPGHDEPDQYISEEQAVTGHTRVSFVVPERGEFAFMFSEICSRGTSGTRIFNEFKSFFGERLPGITMSYEVITEGSDWLSNIIGAKSIAIKSDCVPCAKSKVFDGNEGSYEVSVRASKGKLLAVRLLNKLRNFPKDAIVELGFPEETDIGKLSICAKAIGEDRREKTIDLFDDCAAPAFRRTLSENGEPELSNEEFARQCSGYACKLLERYGQI